MTYDPNQGNPIPYYGPPPEYFVPNPRPTSVTVLAILAIIFGGLGTACGWAGILPYVGVSFGTNAFTDMINQDAILHGWTIFSMIYGWIMAVILLISGIMCLKLKPLGRGLMLFYIWASLVTSVPGLYVNAVYMMPKIEQLHAQHPNDPAMTGAVFGAKFGAYGGLAIGLIVFAVVLIVMTRPHVKAAFAGQPAGPVPPPPYYPPNYPPPGAPMG